MNGQPKKMTHRFDRYSVIIGVLTIFTLNTVFAIVQVQSMRKLDGYRSEIMESFYPFLVRGLDSGQNPVEDDLSETVSGLLANPVFDDIKATIEDPLFEAAVVYFQHSDDSESALLVLEGIYRIMDRFEEDKDRSFEILFFLYFALAVILLFFLLYSEYENQQALADERSRRAFDKKLIRLLEQERNFLSLELHDDVAQKLSVLKQHFNPGNERAEHTEVLERYTSDLIDSIRSLSGRLRSPDLTTTSLSEQLELLFSDFRATSNIALESGISGLKILEPDGERDSHIYRIIQELLSNCRRHSRAESASLKVLYSHPLLKIFYQDDGIGYQPGIPTDGLGIKGMDYRLNILGGNRLWASSDTTRCGTKCRITVPVAQ